MDAALKGESEQHKGGVIVNGAKFVLLWNDRAIPSRKSKADYELAYVCVPTFPASSGLHPLCTSALPGPLRR